MKEFTLIPLEEVTQPKDGLFKIYEDYYFFVTKDNCILSYRNYSLQCNKNKQVLESLLKDYEDVEIRQIRFVYIPINPSDY
jgi:hypothetical protein